MLVLHSLWDTFNACAACVACVLCSELRSAEPYKQDCYSPLLADSESLCHYFDQWWKNWLMIFAHLEKYIDIIKCLVWQIMQYAQERARCAIPALLVRQDAGLLCTFSSLLIFPLTETIGPLPTLIRYVSYTSNTIRAVLWKLNR